MSSFISMQEIISRLKVLGEQLQNSKLSEEELTELSDLARELYERTIVLNYKAKEEKVYEKQQTQVEVEDEVETAHEENSIVEIQKTENEIIETFLEEDQKSLHGDQPDDQPKEHSGVASSFMQLDFSDAFGIQEEEDKIEKTEEFIKSEETYETVAPEIIAQEDDKLSESEQLFYEDFLMLYKNAMSNKLGNAKISSLIGAFGLNDKIMFSKELFNGNSDTFNQTISLLDSLPDYKKALFHLSKMAVDKNWEKDAQITEDFAHIVIRRYV